MTSAKPPSPSHFFVVRPLESEDIFVDVYQRVLAHPGPIRCTSRTESGDDPIPTVGDQLFMSEP
jgi:hypothetical protein